jgi:transposase InsO family protein
MAREALSMPEKLAMVLAAEQPGVVLKDLCAAMGVHRDTLHEWRRRFRECGVEGLVERSRRPLHSPGQTPAALEDEIVRLRKELRLENGADAIGWHLRRNGWVDVPSDRTIHRILVRRGMVVPQPNKRPKGAWQRFEFARPNECWQIDATSWTRARGRPVTVMDIIDDHSRVLCAIRAGAGPTTELALETVFCGGQRWGLPAMVLSDNGTCFAGVDGTGCTFEPVLAAAGIKWIHSRPYHPQTCGKVERFHATLKRHLRKQPLARSTTELQHQLDEFADEFNHHRQSSAGGELTAAERHAATPAAANAADPIDYTPAAMLSLSDVKVGNDGALGIAGYWRTSVGTEHAGRRLTVLRYGDHAVVTNGADVIARLDLDPDRRYLPSGRPRGGPRRRPY